MGAVRRAGAGRQRAARARAGWRAGRGGRGGGLPTRPPMRARNPPPPHLPGPAPALPPVNAQPPPSPRARPRYSAVSTTKPLSLLDLAAGAAGIPSDPMAGGEAGEWRWRAEGARGRAFAGLDVARRWGGRRGWATAGSGGTVLTLGGWVAGCGAGGRGGCGRADGLEAAEPSSPASAPAEGGLSSGRRGGRAGLAGGSDAGQRDGRRCEGRMDAGTDAGVSACREREAATGSARQAGRPTPASAPFPRQPRPCRLGQGGREKRAGRLPATGRAPHHQDGGVLFSRGLWRWHGLRWRAARPARPARPARLARSSASGHSSSPPTGPPPVVAGQGDHGSSAWVGRGARNGRRCGARAPSQGPQAPNSTRPTPPQASARPPHHPTALQPCPHSCPPAIFCRPQHAAAAAA